MAEMTTDKDLQDTYADLPSFTLRSLQQLPSDTARSFGDLTPATARSISSAYSFTSANSVESFDAWNDDESTNPPSFYHMPEMNREPAPTVARLAAVPSQYHLDELRDYQALQENPYMLKMATSKCVLNRQ